MRLTFLKWLLLLFLLTGEIVWSESKSVSRQKVPTLVITKTEHFGSPETGRVGMKGEATNPGNKPLENVTAVVVYLKDGKKKEQQEILAFRTLRPKETQRFTVSVDVDDPKGKYLIGFGLAGGKPLNVVYLSRR